MDNKPSITISFTMDSASLFDFNFVETGVAIQLASMEPYVDGTDPELVRGILETELASIEGRHKQKISFWQDVASMGPAFCGVSIDGTLKMSLILFNPPRKSDMLLDAITQQKAPPKVMRSYTPK